MRRAALAAAVGLLLALTVMVIPAGLRATSWAADPSPGAMVAATEELQAIVVSTQLYPGRNHLLIDLLDRDGRRLTSREPDVEVRIGSPGAPADRVVPAEIVQPVGASRSLLRSVIEVDQPGRWSLAVTARFPDRTLSGGDWFDVLDDGTVLPLGAAVPRVDTPTLASAGTLEAITTEPAPDPSYYVTSVSQALDAGIPFAFAIDSVGFRTNEACGGGLGHLSHLRDEMPTLTLIHAEPFLTTLVDGALALDPPGGPPQLAPWSRAFGISEPPWTFIVDATGHLRGKYAGIVGSDELRSVMQEVVAEVGG